MRLRLFFILVFVLGSIVGSYYFVTFVGHNVLGHVTWTTRFTVLIVASVVLQLLAHAVRAYKSKYLLNTIRPTKTITLFRGVSVGFLFNTLLPFRIGEFIRAFYVGDALSISKTAVLLSIVIERVIDGFILGIALIFISAGFSLGGISHSAFSIVLRLGIGLVVISSVLQIFIRVLASENRRLLRLIHAFTGVFNNRLADRMRFMAWSGIHGTKLMLSNHRNFRKYYVVSVFMWLIYFSSMACTALAFYPGLSRALTWHVVQSVYAGISSAAGPGYISTFHSILSDLLQKVSLPTYASFSLVVWLVLAAPISLVGIYVLVRQRFAVKKDVLGQEALIHKLYRETDISAELGHFLDAYFTGEEINQLLSQAELEGKFTLIKSFKGGSNAHTMLVWQNEEYRVKKITLPQFADKLEEQAKWLTDRASLKHIPTVIRQEKTDQYYYFDLVYKQDFTPFFDFIHSHSVKQSYTTLQKVLAFMDSAIYEDRPASNERQNLNSYITSKILGKVNDTAVMSDEIRRLLRNRKLVINGTSYDNIPQVIEKIKKHKRAMQDLSTYPETPIHGDLTIDNLIASAKGDFMIIDPNNENQVSSPVVDYGKLYQSLHSGYEFLIQLEQARVKGKEINFEDSKSQKYAELYRLIDTDLQKSLGQGAYRSILFHEAVHYCRMLTYRANINPRTVAVFYATAVKLFNEFLEQYEPDTKNKQLRKKAV